ncbi:hypothetical protein T484DRAFT_1843686, partial [Baffinella frigidus]
MLGRVTGHVGLSVRGSGKHGGGIAAWGGATLSLFADVRMHGNHAVEQGGGVFIETGKSSSGVSFSARNDVIFESNSCGTHGGGVAAIHIGRRGGDSMDMSDTIDLVRRSGGGIAMASGTLLLSNITMDDNHASASGGGVYVAGGGHLQVSGNWSISSNSARLSGGGLTADGGQVLLEGNASVRYNRAGTDGGGLEVTTGGDLVARGNILIGDNIATFDAGGIKGVEVSRNSARFYGGGILVKGATLTASASVRITGNSARSAGGVGAFVFLKESRVTLSGGVVVSGNTAVLQGGGLMLLGCILMARNCSVIDNHAAHGGGLYAGERSMALMAESAEFAGNSARTAGGGVFLESSRLECRDSVLSRNVGGGVGGALRMTLDSQTRLERCAVRENKAGESACVDADRGMCGGGGIAAGDSAVVNIARGSLLEANDAGPGAGGGLLVSGSSNITVSESTLRSNLAGGDGGGVACFGASTVHLADSVMTNNRAGGRGGAVFAGTSNNLTLGGSIDLAGNSAASDGGAVFSEGEVALAAGGLTRVQGNAASKRGGGLALKGQQLHLMAGHSLLATANTAQDGGGVALLEGSSIQVHREECHTECDAGKIGDGTCDPACLTRGCRWDDGDCDSRFLSAGTSPGCSRQDCAVFSNTSTDACVGECFTAGCEWGGDKCKMARAAVGSCSFYDAVALHSMKLSTTDSLLPGLGVNYSDLTIASLEASRLDLIQAQGRPDIAFAKYPGCGSAPLLIDGNQATRYGGGIFYEGGDSCALMGQECFIDGLQVGLVAVRLQDNVARLAGGAIHVGCAGVSRTTYQCRPMLERRVRLAVDAGGVTTAGLVVQMWGNSAGQYGARISSLPASMEWTEKSNVSFAPGLEKVGVAVQLYDSQGSLVRATSHAITFRMCRASKASCKEPWALSAAVVETVDGGTGLAGVELDGECVIGSDDVELRASCTHEVLAAVGARRIVHCACGAGQARIESRSRGTWHCKECASDAYVIDPNNAAHSCTTCPAGATCSGGLLLPKLQGSVFEASMEAGTYRLTSCPAGYEILLTAIAAEEACRQCDPGWYCVGRASTAARCPVGSHSQAGAKEASGCATAVIVSLSLALPMRQTVFEQAGTQGQLKEAMGDAAGVEASSVLIVGYAERSDRRNGARALLPVVLDVDIQIASADTGSAQAILDRLDVDTVNQHLLQNELPRGTITRSPEIIMTEADRSVELVAVSGTCVIAALVVLGVVLAVARRYWGRASRRLLDAEEGTLANQWDLPGVLRGKHQAQRLLASGAHGVVLEVAPKNTGVAQHLAVTWAVKLVHASDREARLSDGKIRRLQRE